MGSSYYILREIINYSSAMASKEAVSKGIHAGNIIKEVTKIGNGSGEEDQTWHKEALKTIANWMK